MNIKILGRQSLQDIAIQHTGDVSNAFLIAAENSLSVSGFLVPGYELVIPHGVAFNREVLNYYTGRQIKPATGTVQSHSFEIVEMARGIGAMRVEGDFKVS